MHFIARRSLLFMAVLGLSLLAAACGDGVDPGGSKGTLIITIDADPPSILVGEDTSLTAEVTGPGSASPVIEWAAPDGTLSSNEGSIVTWTAPPEPGDYTITAQATADGKTVSSDITIPVAHEMQCDAGNLADRLDPCAISTLDQLQAIKYHVSGHFILGDDINASDTENWNGGAGFDPIGTRSNPFIGSLNGDKRTISGLYINRTQRDVGLFGILGEGAEVTDLTLTGVKITNSESNTGALAGQNMGSITSVTAGGTIISEGSSVGGLAGQNGGTISDASFSGSVTVDGDNDRVGGLVGGNFSGGTVEYAQVNARVTSSGDTVGGLVGFNAADATITRTEVILNDTRGHNVNGYERVGGLVGRNIGTIEYSYAAGTDEVKADNGHVGGLVGTNESTGVINNTYTDVSKVGSDFIPIGGLVAANYGTITKSHSVSKVPGPLGGLVGTSDGGTVEHSYWNSQTTGATQSAGGEGKTTHQMRQEQTYEGWDFQHTWRVGGDATYPLLLWADP